MDAVQPVLYCIFVEEEGLAGSSKGLVLLKIGFQKPQVLIRERGQDFFQEELLVFPADAGQQDLQRQVVKEGKYFLFSERFQRDAGCGKGAGQVLEGDGGAGSRQQGEGMGSVKLIQLFTEQLQVPVIDEGTEGGGVLITVETARQLVQQPGGIALQAGEALFFRVPELEQQHPLGGGGIYMELLQLLEKLRKAVRSYLPVLLQKKVQEIVFLFGKRAGSGADLLLPEDEEGDSLRQVGEGADLLRLSADADDRCQNAAAKDRDVHSLLGAGEEAILVHLQSLAPGDDLPSALVDSADPRRVCAGDDKPPVIDKIDIVAADLLDGVRDLLCGLPVYHVVYSFLPLSILHLALKYEGEILCLGFLI